MSKKIILIVFVIIVIGGIGYLIYQSKTKESADKAIQQLFVEKYPNYAETLSVNIEKETKNHARGSVNFVAGAPGGLFLAVKSDDKWQIVHEGNGQIPCSLSSYGFPADMLSDCATTPESEVQILENEEVKDETVDWKVYMNEESGYSFQCPKDWNAVTNKYNSKNALFGPGATEENGYGGVEYMGKLSTGQSLIEFTEQYNSQIEGYSESQGEYVNINGDAVITIFKKASLEPMETKSVAFEEDGNVFNMYLNYKTNFTQYPEDKQRLDIFNQMLFTFKFTD